MIKPADQKERLICRPQSSCLTWHCGPPRSPWTTFQWRTCSSRNPLWRSLGPCWAETTGTDSRHEKIIGLREKSLSSHNNVNSRAVVVPSPGAIRGSEFQSSQQQMFILNPHSHPNGSYWGHQCSWTLTTTNIMQWPIL